MEAGGSGKGWGWVGGGAAAVHTTGERCTLLPCGCRLEDGPMPVVERRALALAVAVFVIALAAGALVVVHFSRLEVEARRRAATELAQGSALAIEQRFASALAAASTVAAMVREGATDRQLDGVAARLLDLTGGTLSVQLARDGVISHVWPMKGNEAAFRLDLVRHPVHARFVQRVIETGAPLIYGPFELVQGGTGVALRIPVFVEVGGVERFWGLSSAILRMKVLLDESRVPNLAGAGFDYAIRRLDAAGGPGELLATSGTGPGPLADAVTVPVHLPGQQWTLGVVPRQGWGGLLTPGVLPLGLLLIALLAALLSYRAGALPALLRREVAARTLELQVAHDEQRRAEDAQRQSQKLESIGLLAGGVAHDFNNLLVGILGYADVLASEAKPGSDAEEAARTIIQAAQRAAELTRQLLAVARLGQHKSERVDVHAMVMEATALLGRTLDKSIRLETKLGAALHDVRGDPGQLQQVILNLAVNARDAMPEGGTLTLETADVEFDAATVLPGLSTGSYVTLSVSDTGVGIPEPDQQRIFEPFYTTKAEGKGSGLGLATVFGIAKGHGGTVRVYSELGRGSRFVVYLPLLGEGASLAEPVDPGAPRGTGRVLVVDDEELVRKTAARVLESLGYEPVLVSGGQEALDWLARQPKPPVAVLLDLSMPGMDGRTCFRSMRARVPDLRVIVSSGFSKLGRGDELLAEGAVAFVQKPYRTGELARALAAGRDGEPTARVL
jgi:two-component system cell cycle sensor histidine kinase/response regulator CckA